MKKEKEKKKGGCLGTILKILAVFVIFMVVIVIAFGGDSDDSSTNTAETSETTAEETSTEETTLEETSQEETTAAETTAEETSEEETTEAVTTAEETTEAVTEELSEIDQMRNYLLQFEGADYYLEDADDDSIEEFYYRVNTYVEEQCDGNIDIDEARLMLYDSEYAIYTEEEVSGFSDFDVVLAITTLEDDYWLLAGYDSDTEELTEDNYTSWFRSAEVNDKVYFSEVDVLKLFPEYDQIYVHMGSHYFYLNMSTSGLQPDDKLYVEATYVGT
ncbi:MAG: hypothetical protein LUE63_08520 [Lachnospiraceae bacterium]|nr:hypothetical protein [Lachnospiraceae bacterium]